MNTAITDTVPKPATAIHSISGKRRFRHLPRIMVIGGAGFIGSHVVEALLVKGHSVRVFDDLSTGKLQNLPLNHPDLELRIGNILDHASLRDALNDIHGCIHLAAQVSAARSVEEPRESALCNVLGFINVLEAARSLQLKRLVYASSAAVYGNCPNLPLVEDETPKPVNPYGLEKHVDELYADLYFRQYGLRALGLRFFNVYGPRQDPSSPYSGVISKFLDCLSAEHAPCIFGDGSQTRDFIHVRDVAQACLVALESEYCGVCNVATGQRVNLLRMVDILSAAMDVTVTPEFAPARAGDIRHSCGSSERLQRQLCHKPRIDLELGLTELAGYYRRQSAINITGARRF
ncbi:MAG: NAD-dependent epimerase/dehydratase family protein [Stenotrophobium sp.]